MAVADTPPVITDELAVEIARLGRVRGASDVGTLRRVTELATRAVSGCAGATTERWSLAALDRDPSNPMPQLTAASHPDLAELVDTQLARGAGPIFDAVAARTPLSCEDTLAETRWPVDISAMLRRGVRCFATTVYDNGDMLVTLTLYGVLPGALDPRRLAVAALLVAQGGAAVSNTQEYDDAHRTAVQLRQAVAARAVIDQAKGILMHALGCDAETAFAELRRISQTRHVKLTAIAQRIVAGDGLPDGPGQTDGSDEHDRPDPARRHRP
ncbi:MAG: ANTAR domain-containing response regulator [Actinomadura sp.]